MPANFITLAHFSVSAAMRARYSAGGIDNGTLPRSASRALIAGSASAAFTSVLSLPMISAGVLAGAPMPSTADAS